jgi:hypothetical protein
MYKKENPNGARTLRSVLILSAGNANSKGELVTKMFATLAALSVLSCNFR